MNPMGTSTVSDEELKEIENLGREDIEEAPIVPEDVSRIAPWIRQITLRGLVASFLIGIIYSVIVMKLNLTTGLVPNLNVSAALLGFVFIRAWTKVLAKQKMFILGHNISFRSMEPVNKNSSSSSTWIS